jgi:hypothetical protein
MSLGLAQRAWPPTTINGVQFGVETFSFQDLPPSGDPRIVPTIIGNMRDIGLAECEIMSAHIEPFPGVSTGWWVQARRAPEGTNVCVKRPDSGVSRLR